MSLAWRLVALLWFAALLNYLDRQVIFSLLPLLRQELSLTDTQMGLLATAFLWIYAAASLASGFAAAKLGARRVILLSLGFWSAITLLTGFTRTANELLVARAIMGLSEAFYLPAALALVAEFHGNETRGRATALHQSGIYVGIMLGGLFGGWLGEHYGWRMPFYILGGIGLLYTPWLAWMLPPSNKSTTATAHVGLASLFRIPGYPAMVAVFALFSMAGWVVVTWTSLYLYERFGMTLAQAGFASTFFLQAGSFAGIFSGGWISDRWRNPLARVYLPFAGFVLSAIFIFLSGAANNATLALAAMTAYGVGRGFYDANIMPLLCLTARPDQRAPGYGIFNFAGTFVGGVSAFGAGMVKAEIGIDGAFRWCSLVVFAAALLLIGPIRKAVSEQSVKE